MTFLETMIVLAVIGILSTIVIVSYNTTKERSNVKNAAKQIESAIKQAQAWAVTGKCDTSGGSCELPCGWGFYIVDPNTYSIYYEPGGSCGTSCGHGSDYETHDIEKVTLGGTSDICYDIPYANSGGGSITVSSEANPSISITLDISTSGGITTN